MKQILLAFLVISGVVFVNVGQGLAVIDPGNGSAGGVGPSSSGSSSNSSGSSTNSSGSGNQSPIVRDSVCQGTSSECVCPANKTKKANPDGTDYCSGDPAVNGKLTGCASGVSNCNIATKYLNPFIKLLSVLVGIAVVIGIIVGGIQYSASGGDPQKAAKAKAHIRNSIIALLAFFFLYAFLRFLTPGSGLLN